MNWFVIIGWPIVTILTYFIDGFSTAVVLACASVVIISNELTIEYLKEKVKYYETKES